jgi:uncharacterized protein YaiL (DUF2058 family)
MFVQDNAETLALIEGRMGIISVLNGKPGPYSMIPRSFRAKTEMMLKWGSNQKLVIERDGSGAEVTLIWQRSACGT